MGIKLTTLVVDTNGDAAGVAGLVTRDYNLPHYRAFGEPVRYVGGPNYRSSAQSTADVGVVFFGPRGDITDPVHLPPGGNIIVPGATGFRVVWCYRAGVLFIEHGDVSATVELAVSPRLSRGSTTFKGGVFPITQDTTDPTLWYHPNSAPGAASPMVCGASGDIADFYWRANPTFTASHWTHLWLVDFEVTDDGTATRDIRRLVNLTNQSVFGQVMHAHRRLGVMAVPSSTHPAPGTSPATMFMFGLGIFRPYSRNIDPTMTLGAQAALS